MEAQSLYLECNSGISGDMAVAALLDAGADAKVLEEVLKTIPASGFTTAITRVSKSGVDCCDFNVVLDADHENHDHDMEYLFGNAESEHTEHGHHHDEHSEHSHNGQKHTHEHEHGHHHEHRTVSDIHTIIDGTQMTVRARTIAKKIISIIAEAESKAHNIPVEQVHFHEVGAIDSIVDVIALAVCFDNLNVNRVYVPRLCEGSGMIRCQHGLLPVPVPAVANIAARYGLSLELIHEKGEFVTPTGAAFVAAVKTDDILPQCFAIKKIGMGAGKRAYHRPSILRAFLIEEQAVDNADANTVYKLESNIDDSTGEQLGLVMEQLFSAGAFDVHYTPCFMKKNRPAWLLSVVCSKENITALESIIFRQTTTIGIRRMKYERSILQREIISVQTQWGEVKVKQATLPDGEKRFYPEYECIRTICNENNLNYQSVYNSIVDCCK